MTQRNYCFDIETQWGSHVPMLSAALAALEHGALVIEHGAGMYSSPVISRHDVSVLCIEEAHGWRSWAEWIYKSAGRAVTIEARAKKSVPILPTADLVFVDGAARERADMIRWSLAAGVQCIVAHDTEPDSHGTYGYHSHTFAAPGYVVTHDEGRPRTTMWRRM